MTDRILFHVVAKPLVHGQPDVGRKINIGTYVIEQTDRTPFSGKVISGWRPPTTRQE